MKQTKTAPAGAAVKESRLAFHGRMMRKSAPYWAMLAIPLIFFILFKYWPMFGIVIAFQNYKIGSPFWGSGTKWVAFKWFQKFMTNPYFGRYVANTLILSLRDMLITFPASIIFALLLNEIRIAKLKKFTATVSLLPHFISTVVIVSLMTTLFSVDGGVVNSLISKAGGTPQNFMGTSKWFRTMYTGSDIWQDMGFSAVVFTAAIAGIDPTLYEAAAIDGSSRWKNVFKITLPCILPTIIIMWLLKIGSVMSVSYEKIILMYSPATYDVSDVLSTYAFRVGISEQKYSLSTAISLFNSCCNVILLIFANKLTSHISETSLW